MKTFVLILVLFIPTILILLYNYSKKHDWNRKLYFKSFCKIFALLNLITPSILSFIGFSQLLYPTRQGYLYFLSYFLISLLIAIVYYLLQRSIEKNFIKEKKQYKHKVLVYIGYSLVVCSFFVGIMCFTATIWGKKVYPNADPQQILLTIVSPLTGTDPVIISGFIDESLLLTFACTYLFALFFYEFVAYKHISKSGKCLLLTERWTRTISITSTVALLISGFFYVAYRFNVKDLIISYTQTSTYFDENYVDPASVKMQFPNQKRNLIHIYLESIENSYFNKELGGNMDDNLMPNIANLSKEGISFSHLDKGKGYGGALDAYGCNWSVASMVNQFFGVPMKAPSSRNNYGKAGNFLPGAVGIGDILEKMGYEQTMMIGADSDFGGLTYMFQDHGNFKIMDHKYALDNDMLPSKNYSVKWGYEDEKLYKFAKDELTRLANTGKPFHFLMENADTHAPGLVFDGDVPDFTTLRRTFDYGKTIRFSEKHVYEFVKWIMEQPFYENTTVVIIGDHLSMDSFFFFENDFSNFTRTTYNLILNPSENVKGVDESRFYNRKWTSYDFMPTILSALGVKFEGDVLGVGTNLFSSSPTLFERDGYKEVNDYFLRKSIYYNEKLLNGKNNYNGDNLSLY